MKRIFIALASLVMAATAVSAQELTNFSFWGQKPVVSPEIQNDSVTFRLKAEYATVVKLSGSWMPGWGATIDMTRGEYAYNYDNIFNCFRCRWSNNYWCFTWVYNKETITKI